MTSVAKALREMGFKRTTRGSQYGIQPRLVLDNVEISLDKEGIDVRVEHPEGLYGGPARTLTLWFKDWPKDAAVAVVAAMVKHRGDGLKR